MQEGRWLSSEAYEEICLQSACCADSASYFDSCSIRASQQIHLFSQGKGRKSGIRESSLKYIEPYNPY